MNIPSVLIVCAAFFIYLAAPLYLIHSQTIAGQQSEQKITVSTSEVPVDLIVRDKKGLMLKNLNAADVELFEDGVRQEIKSFRYINRNTPLVTDSPPDMGTTKMTERDAHPPSSLTSATIRKSFTGPAGGVNAIAIVFDRLTPSSRATARDAALSYVNANARPGDLIGVFEAGLSLNILQQYTSDVGLVRKAIERAGVIAPSLYTSNNEEARKVREWIIKVLNDSSISAQSKRAAIDQMAMALRSLESWEELQRNQQGSATTNGLLAVVDGLKLIEGRKALIFLSEGVAIPSDVAPQFMSVVNEANRAQTSIYTVDAAGLRTESTVAEARKEIESRSSLRMGSLGYEDAIASLGPMTKGLERNEDLIRLDPQSGLAFLAAETGGFSIRDTNDLKGRINRIGEDMSSYYLLSYVPKNQNYDGHFRRIEIKLRREGLNIQSRKGYYAINGAYSSPVLSYEAPALALSDSGAARDELGIRAGAWYFPDPGRPGLVPVMAEIPLRFVTFAGDEAKKQYRTNFSAVVLIRDERRQVVKKLSNRYVLTGDLVKLAAARQGEVLFYRDAELEPGRYTVQAIVYDALGNKASIRQQSLEVPEGDESAIKMSSLVLIKRAERLSAEDLRRPNPFQVGELLAYPNMGEEVFKSSGKTIPFFINIYPPKGSKQVLTAVIELLQAGRSLANLPSELPAPDGGGRIQYSGGLPLQNIPPGNYTLRITVVDADRRNTSRSNVFTVAK